MKFFIDTANVEQIRDAASIGILDGVTTNPNSLFPMKPKSYEYARLIVQNSFWAPT